MVNTMGGRRDGEADKEKDAEQRLQHLECKCQLMGEVSTKFREILEKSHMQQHRQVLSMTE